jgi:hypothetical protein
MIENGDLEDPQLKPTPEFAFRSIKFGTVVAHQRSLQLESLVELNRYNCPLGLKLPLSLYRQFEMSRKMRDKNSSA